MSRGVANSDTFIDDLDFRKFIAVLAEAKGRMRFALFAFCLMPNHFHLLIQPHRSTISEIMQLVLTRYAVYFNLRRGRQGHVFQARFKALVCDRQSYFSELIRYIHLNPVRAKIVPSPERWNWSSHRDYEGESGGLVDSARGLSWLSENMPIESGESNRIEGNGDPIPLSSRPELEGIGREAAEKCGISIDAMRSRSRSHVIWNARRIFVDQAVHEGWRQYEIAQFLGCSQAAISKRLAKSVVKVVKA